MIEPNRTSSESLLAHTGWVSALARKLVADPQGAEDVVQDAMALALERPPGCDTPVRAWLAGAGN